MHHHQYHQHQSQNEAHNRHKEEQVRAPTPKEECLFGEDALRGVAAVVVVCTLAKEEDRPNCAGVVGAAVGVGVGGGDVDVDADAAAGIGVGSVVGAVGEYFDVGVVGGAASRLHQCQA